MEKISYKLDVFEGPMDLLLHLIQKHKLNIYDIPIITLVEQYIDYVNQMKEENMYIASDFLEMAARLVYLKSVSLLPVYKEAEQLKKELQGELIEYRDMKQMAQELQDTNTPGMDMYSRNPIKMDIDQTYKRFHEPNELIDAYINAVGRRLNKLPPPIEVFKDIVIKKVVSVSSKIGSIFSKFSRKGQKRSFKSLFEDAKSRSDLVATFLAVLELAKSNNVKLIDNQNDDLEIELVNNNYSEISEEWNE